MVSTDGAGATEWGPIANPGDPLSNKLRGRRGCFCGQLANVASGYAVHRLRIAGGLNEGVTLLVVQAGPFASAQTAALRRHQHLS